MKKLQELASTMSSYGLSVANNQKPMVSSISKVVRVRRYYSVQSQGLLQRKLNTHKAVSRKSVVSFNK